MFLNVCCIGLSERIVMAGRTREALQQTATNAAMITGGVHTVLPFIALGAYYHLNASNPDIDWQGDHDESASDLPFFQQTFGPTHLASFFCL